MPLKKSKIWIGPVLLAALGPLPATAGAPDWVLALSQVRLPSYTPGTKAVCLLDWGRTVITESGEIKSQYRMAYRILTSEGTSLAWIQLPFDQETKISNLKAWNLTAPGVVHEAGMKEAVETQLSAGSGVLFADTKLLLLLLPQVEVDSIIAYEFERRHRPYILQDIWYFQQTYPVVHSQFELELPKGWEYSHRILNHAPLEPKPIGNLWVWELANLPAVPEEEGMPPRSSVTATLAVSYFPGSDKRRDVRGQLFASWDDVAHWAAELMEPRLNPSVEISETARRLGTPRALAEFVQNQVRYVAIEIGIGGYQPHHASETLTNRYGDCKDKVTLLRSLMRTLNYDLHPVLIDTGRRGVVREFPSPLNFNHMIAAIPLREVVAAMPAVVDHPELGKLLLFDPTDDRTPYGELPPELQGTSALLVHGERSYIIETPVAFASYDRLLRSGSFTLLSVGRLLGKFQDVSWGHTAAMERVVMQGGTHYEWFRRAEDWLAASLPGVRVSKISVGGLNEIGMLSVAYEIEAPYFAQAAGELLLFRPSLIELPLPWPPRSEKRSYPFHFRYVRGHSHHFEYQLPEGFVIEALPLPVEITTTYASYRLKISQNGNRVVYSALFEIKKLSVPAEDVQGLREFFASVERADNALIVLKRLPQSPATPAAPAKPPT